MIKEDIIDEIVNIINMKFKKEIYEIDGFEHLPLTGKELNLTAIEMAYLYLEILKRWSFSELGSETLNYGFNTIDKIAIIVQLKLEGTNLKC